MTLPHPSLVLAISVGDLRLPFAAAGFVAAIATLAISSVWVSTRDATRDAVLPVAAVLGACAFWATGSAPPVAVAATGFVSLGCLLFPRRIAVALIVIGGALSLTALGPELSSWQVAGLASAAVAAAAGYALTPAADEITAGMAAACAFGAYMALPDTEQTVTAFALASTLACGLWLLNRRGDQVHGARRSPPAPGPVGFAAAGPSTRPAKFARMAFAPVTAAALAPLLLIGFARGSAGRGEAVVFAAACLAAPLAVAAGARLARAGRARIRDGAAVVVMSGAVLALAGRLGVVRQPPAEAALASVAALALIACGTALAVRLARRATGATSDHDP